MTKFPLKLVALWRLTYPSVMLGVLLQQSFKWLQTGRFDWPSALPFAFAAALLALYLYFFYPIKAGPEGLLLMDYWGIHKFVRWDEIVEVRRGRQFGIYSGFRVQNAKGKVFWIGTDTKNLGGLHALAVQNGGPEHPLAIVLATPLHAM